MSASIGKFRGFVCVCDLVYFSNIDVPLLYISRLQAELDEARRRHQEELTATVEKTRAAASLELSMQRHEYEDKLAELEKALVGIIYVFCIRHPIYGILFRACLFGVLPNCQLTNATEKEPLNNCLFL